MLAQRKEFVVVKSLTTRTKGAKEIMKTKVTTNPSATKREKLKDFQLILPSEKNENNPAEPLLEELPFSKSRRPAFLRWVEETQIKNVTLTI